MPITIHSHSNNSSRKKELLVQLPTIIFKKVIWIELRRLEKSISLQNIKRAEILSGLIAIRTEMGIITQEAVTSTKGHLLITHQTFSVLQNLKGSKQY